MGEMTTYPRMKMMRDELFELDRLFPSNLGENDALILKEKRFTKQEPIR